MHDINEKIEMIQTWINTFHQNHPSDVGTPEVIVNKILGLIRAENDPTPPQGMSETYADLEKQVQDQSAALNRATNNLKTQIRERETAAQKLRKAYNDLETHLQGHITYQTQLNQRLQKQINEQKLNQAIEQEERLLTEALRETLATMGRTLDLDKVLDHILDTVKRVAPYDGANILLVESDLVRVACKKGYNVMDTEKAWLEKHIPLTKLTLLQHMINVGKAVATPDTSNSATWIGFPGLDWIGSNVIAPIRSNGKVLGFLSLDSATPGYFTQTHADRLEGFADQAAIAIQNARLLERAKQTAVLAERTRLANELHDTISQTLWSISLISERLPVIWENDIEKGRISLATLHELAQSALIEMRSLLLEIHPASILTGAKLGDLIQQAAGIITNRTGLDISVQIENQKPIPPDVHFALYRIVQEALNNVVLHASASEVNITYNSTEEQVKLTVQNNGRGFDPDDIDPSRLGMRIMKDRIKNIGGTLEILSSKGKPGTVITVLWRVPID